MANRIALREEIRNLAGSPGAMGEYEVGAYAMELALESRRTHDSRVMRSMHVGGFK
jgi:hypothetical protein